MNEKSLDANVTTHSARDEFSRSRRRAIGETRTDVASVRALGARSAASAKRPDQRKETAKGHSQDTPRPLQTRRTTDLSNAHHFFSSFFLSEGRMRFGGSRMRRASTERTRTTLLWIAALMQ